MSPHVPALAPFCGLLDREMPYDENDPVAKPRISAFMQALADLGWTDGRNVRMVLRGAGGDINRMPALARELVGLQLSS